MPERQRESFGKKTPQFEIKRGMVQPFICIDGVHISVKMSCKGWQDYFKS